MTVGEKEIIKTAKVFKEYKKEVLKDKKSVIDSLISAGIFNDNGHLKGIYKQ